MNRKRLSISIVVFILSVLAAAFLEKETTEKRFLSHYSLNSAKERLYNQETRLSEDGLRWQILIHQNSFDFISDFWIDQVPVTVRAYRYCLSEGRCAYTPHYRDEYTFYYTDERYWEYPVTFVSWYEAVDYCEAMGGFLPTKAQWEIAAGIFDGKRYPWGDDEPSLLRANYDEFFGGLTNVGSFPAGASVYGILDLGGNVREWVMDVFYPEKDGLFDFDFRPANVVREEALAAENLSLERYLKGGGASDEPQMMETKQYFHHEPDSPGFNRGFRCVYPVERD